MPTLPFDRLQPYKARGFVPLHLDLADWQRLEPLFERLEGLLREVTSVEALEAWLLQWSELNAALDEEGAIRYIAMTCNTEDADAEKAYLAFVEELEPKVKPRQFQISGLYVQHPVRTRAPLERYRVFDRDTRSQVELFRPANVALETEESKLSQQYQKLTGSLTVQFQGKEQTLIQMGRYLEEVDRELRREAWELVARRRLKEADNYERVFDELVSLRDRIAHNAGFPNYRDFAFRKMNRFDYTPADCEQFHAAVETEVMPVVRQLQAARRERLGLDSLRPWDLTVDARNRPPLRPFQSVDELTRKTGRIFDHLDPSLGRLFHAMRDARLLDLENRKGKGPGGYQSTLAEARVPFIFMNAVGLQRDVETLLHEAGHAFHAFASQDEDLYAYRNPPIEICEVASMSMELLGNQFLEEFYSEAEANRARETHLEEILSILPWIALVDAFQHWIYLHPRHTRKERSEAWINLMNRFGGDVDWSGYGEQRAMLWHRQLHIFMHPFYYIEYGIAQLGALQVWANSRRDRSHALARYKSALALGGSRPLPELFASAGCRFEFGREAIAPLVSMMREELTRLSAK